MTVEIHDIAQASRLQCAFILNDRRIAKNGAPETWTVSADPDVLVDRQRHLDHVADVLGAERLNCGDPRWAALRAYVALIAAELAKREEASHEH